MRLHEHEPLLWPRYDTAFVTRLLRVENLVAVRLEPVYSVRFEAFMDALFECDGDWLVVPMLRVDGVSIMVPENPPVTWPTRYEAFAGATTDAIDAEIVPWLRSITAGRLVNDEHVRFYRNDARLLDAYEEARSKKLIGATPYPDVLRSVGGSAYALRFARDARVALRGEDAANGAVVLSNVAAAIDVDADAFSRRWFAGLTLGTIDATAAYGCYVGPRALGVTAAYNVFDGEAVAGERAVSLAEPIPTDVTLSFDVEDGPEARRFAITERALPLQLPRLADPAPAGVSTGCIRLVVRDDASRFRDADVDAADALAARLRAQGFDAEVTIASHVDVSRADIIHIFDLRHGASIVELLRDAEASRVPVVVTPYADDRRNEAISGSSGSLLIPRVSSDTLAFYDFAWAFGQRKISNLSEGEWYGEASRLILARATAAVVAAPGEGDFLRERFGFSGSTVPSAATIPVVPPDPRVAGLVGPHEFILIHAPIESRTNLIFAALAAQQLGLPLVLLGPVADIEFYRYLNEIAGPGVIQLREDGLTAAEIAGVYGRARVVADVAWSSRGLHRLARAASQGTAIVAPAFGYAAEVWGEAASYADPASLESIRTALREAWHRALGDRQRLLELTAASCDPMAALVAAVSAYQQTAAQPAS